MAPGQLLFVLHSGKQVPFEVELPEAVPCVAEVPHELAPVAPHAVERLVVSVGGEPRAVLGWEKLYAPRRWVLRLGKWQAAAGAVAPRAG